MRSAPARLPPALLVGLALLSLHCAHGGGRPSARGSPDPARDSQLLGLTAEARDVFAIGTFSGALDWGTSPGPVSRGAEDVFVARLTPSGTVRWVRALGGSGPDLGDAVTLSQEDTLIAVGMFSGRADFGAVSLEARGPRDCFVSKLSREDGQVRWARGLGGPGGSMSCRSVTEDASGDILVTGRFEGEVLLGTEPWRSAGLNDLFLLKLSGHDGALRWARHFGGAGEDVGRDVAVAPSGVVLLTGLFSQGVDPVAGALDFDPGRLVSQGDADAFLAAFSPDGQTLWARAFGGPTYDQAKSLVVAEDGGIYLTGLMQREDVTPAADGTLFNAGGFEGFLAGFSALGSERWRHRWPALTSGHALALTPGGQLVLAGHFQGTLVLGAGVRVESAGKNDALVAAFTDAGEPLWARRVGGPEHDHGYAVAATREAVALGGQLTTTDGEYRLFIIF